jgi:biotin carboxyl carrier protein
LQSIARSAVFVSSLLQSFGLFKDMRLLLTVLLSLALVAAGQDDSQLSNSPAKRQPTSDASGWEMNLLSGITDADYNRPNGVKEANERQQDVIAPEDIVFVAYSVKPGDHVQVGDSIMVAKLNGQQVTITSGMHGIVRTIVNGLSAGDVVHKGERVALISRPPIQKMTLVSGILFIIVISILAFVISVHRFNDERIKSLATTVSIESEEYQQVRQSQLPQECVPHLKSDKQVNVNEHRAGLPSLSRAAFASSVPRV